MGEGSEIVGMIRLDMAKVLFVSKEIEDPVNNTHALFEKKAQLQLHERMRHTALHAYTQRRIDSATH